MNNDYFISGQVSRPVPAMTSEEALRKRIEELERLYQEKVPQGYVKCHGCGKIVKNGRWLGTLHLCS